MQKLNLKIWFSNCLQMCFYLMENEGYNNVLVQSIYLITETPEV